MSSGKSSWFQRHFLHKTPLYVKGACGNYHPFWQRLCYCFGDGLTREIITGYVLMDEDIRLDQAKMQDLACGVSDALWGGELGWAKTEDGREQLVQTLRDRLRRDAKRIAELEAKAGISK